MKSLYKKERNYHVKGKAIGLAILAGVLACTCAITQINGCIAPFLMRGT